MNHQLTIGLVGLDLAGLALPELFETAKSWGATSVELYNHVNYRGEEIRQVPELIEEYGIGVHAVSSRAMLNSAAGHEVEKVQALMIESIDHAAMVGAGFSVSMYGGNPQFDIDTGLARYLEHLKPVLDHATSAGVTLLVENVFPRNGDDITATVDGTIRLMQAVDHPHFGLCWDPCNYMIGGEEGYPFSYLTLHPYIQYMHLKDAVKYRADLYPSLDASRPMTDDHRGPFVSTPLGAGAMPLQGLVERLNADRFGHVVTVELFCGPSVRERYWRESRSWLERQRIKQDVLTDRSV